MAQTDPPTPLPLTSTHLAKKLWCHQPHFPTESTHFLSVGLCLYMLGERCPRIYQWTVQLTFIIIGKFWGLNSVEYKGRSEVTTLSMRLFWWHAYCRRLREIQSVCRKFKIVRRVQRVNCLHIMLVMIHVVLVNRELKWGDN